jgi:hypothetical protein
MERWKVRQGRTIRKRITLRYKADAPDGSYFHDDPILNVYDGSETLALEIYTGDVEAPASLPNSFVEWIDPPAATLRAVITCPVDLTPTVYRPIITLSDVGETYDAFECYLEVLGAPTVATEPLPTYCSYQDCANVCPWIADLIASNPGMQSDLAEQRNEAREWWDSLLQRHSPRSSGLFDPNIGAGYGLGRNSWLQDELDANHLIVTRPIRRANALYAISLLLECQVGSRDKTSYQVLAHQYRAAADDRAKMIAAEIDTNDDGAGDVVIDMSQVPLLRG